MKKANLPQKTIAALLSAALLVNAAGCVGEPQDGGGTAQTSAQTTAQSAAAQETSAAGSASASSPEETSAAGAASGTAAQEKVLRIGITSPPSGVFMPLAASDDYNNEISARIYEPLVSMDENGEFQPHLASGWEISEDSRTVTFHLQEGVKWHDGEDFTADDVKFTFELISHPDYAGLFSAYVSNIEGYEARHSGEAEELSGVKVIDDHTVSITTTDVYASFLFALGFSVSIVPEHYWADVDPGKISEATEKLHNPIGTGPFKMSRYVEGQFTELVKNPDYWIAEPKLDKLIIVVVNTETSQAQVLNGEIDYLSLYSSNPDDNAIYEENGFELHFVRGNSFKHMNVNTTYNELLGTVEFRQGLAYAINRQGIVDSFLYGFGNVANCPFQSMFWTYPDEDKLNHYEYDPQKALEVLQGIEGITYDGTTMFYQGEPLKLVISYSSGNLSTEGAAVIAQENLGQIGIEVELEIMEYATLVEKMSSGDFQLAICGNGAGLDPDKMSDLFASDGGTNYTHYSNERVDELFEEGLRSLDIEDRAPIYQEIALILNHDLPTIFLCNWDQLYVTNPRVTGMTFSSFDAPDPSWNWDIEQE